MSDQAETGGGGSTATAPNTYPALGYRDAEAAIRWLGEAFGFVARVVYRGEDRGVAHAELSLGPGIIMLGSASEDMPAVDTSALTAGGEPDFSRIPSREYACRDLEGSVWSFGTYRPAVDG